ncbi:TPA: hypothetical protein DEP21_05740 [Patescibacteria group bacterium]|nr:hypothetical protein [Candidatus Gracilibacteria bacterium]
MDLNRDGYLDVLMWDAHSIYVKYGKQKSIYENSKPNVYTKYYDYDSSSLFSSSWYIDSYDQLLDQVYPDDE